MEMVDSTNSKYSKPSIIISLIPFRANNNYKSGFLFRLYKQYFIAEIIYLPITDIFMKWL